MARCMRCGKSSMMLKVNAFGLCPDCAQAEIDRLQRMVTPELQAAVQSGQYVEDLKRRQQEAENRLALLNSQCQQISDLIAAKQKELIQTNEELLVQEFGLYQPKYAFTQAEEYKNTLALLRQRQKDLIKNNLAVTGNTGWTVNGNAAQGKKMVQDMQKLLLRAFNSECDGIVDKVKYNNFEASLKRISSSRDSISKLGKMMGIEITPNYYQSKVEELTLALEYQQKKQEEKEAQKEARARMREEAKLQREIEEARRKAEKEQNHYQNALQRLQKQLATASDVDKQAIEEKIQEVESQLTQIDAALKDIDYREANQKAGYVYVISNVGSFGKDVYKIGMTRRLDPTERVDELGDASVPFNFDIHAMIFSENAPALEAALHRAFEDRKVNMVNPRREFFRVTLDEIKEVVRKNYDKTAEFIDVPEAEQYYISEKMRSEL